VDNLEYLQKMTGESDGKLLSLLLADAEDFVLSYTRRTKIPAELERTVRQLALIAYNRMGTEGESSRSEAGESYSFDDSPKQVYDTLNRYRLARVGGKAYENETQQDKGVSLEDGSHEEG